MCKGILFRVLRYFIREREIRPYYKIRFRWWSPLDIDRFAEDLNEIYETSLRLRYASEGKIEIHKDDRREIKVQADTLYAFLSAYRAVLFQEELVSLTERDLEFEETILKLYPHNRYTPFL